MFKNILLPTDGSELATRAVDQGIALAKAVGAKVTVLTVVEHFRVFTTNPVLLEASIQEYRKQAAEHGQKVLGEASAKAEAAGVAVATMSRTGDVAWEQIVAAAAESGADLVAMASHGRSGLSALMLGSQTSRVLAHSKVPVLVLRGVVARKSGTCRGQPRPSSPAPIQGTAAPLWPLRLMAGQALVAPYGGFAQYVDER